MATTFEVPAGTKALVRISSRSGRVEVHASQGSVIGVEDEGRLERGPGPGEFVAAARSPSRRLVLRCPEGCDLIVGTSSGRVDLHGRLGDVRVTTNSGSVSLEEAERADLRSGSGKTEVEHCDSLRVQAASGDVLIGSCDSAEVGAASGKVVVAEAGRLRARAASGSISAKVRGDTAIETLSGNVRIMVPDALRPALRHRSFRGRLNNECPAGSDLQISVQTLNGDVDVLRA